MKLGNSVVPAVALAVGVVAGVGFGLAYAEAQHAAPAYVLVSGRVVDEDGLAAYGEAAGPLAQAAGIEVLARGDASTVHVMEGEWPLDGFVVVEQFRSMEDFLSFWQSPGYQEAIALRKGKVELDFVVAVEGVLDS